MRLPFSCVITLSLLACTENNSGKFGTGAYTQPDFVDDTQTTDSADTSSSIDSGDTSVETGIDTGGSEPSSEPEFFDEPGDVIVAAVDGNGVAEIDLMDLSGDSNTNQEYYLVMVNTGESALGYSLEYQFSAGEGNVSSNGLPMQRPNQPPVGSVTSQGKMKRFGFQQTEKNLAAPQRQQNIQQPTQPVPPPTAYTASDIGVARQDFKVRDALDNESSYERIGAVLWGLGDSVAIWVDDSVAIDWDYECDGVVDLEAQYDAYGFDNCDLQNIANIVDYNIFPNLRAVFGQESDENSDGRVSVVITPVLNQMTRESENADISLIGSYADPAVDLEAYDPDSNPGSDEQEVIYVFAPDPYGFHNPSALTTIDDYTSVELSAQISSAFYRLISYNQHVLLNEGEQEEAWVKLGLGALAADLTGFGASNFNATWDYLDSTHLRSLSIIEESGSITTSSYGAQYLFFRWLTDVYGTGILASLVQSADIGTDNLEAVVGETLADLAVKWQVALLSSESTQGNGGAPVNATEYPPYAPVSTVTAPINNPISGDYFGANGYQMGVDVGTTNAYMSGGLTTPVENLERQVTMSHQDASTYVFGQDFFGYISEGYGAQVVRLADIPFDATSIEIRSSQSDYQVAVVRAPDPLSINFARDVLYSPTDVNNTVLPLLPNDGSPIYGIGEISAPGVTNVIDIEGNDSVEPVEDTDRWLIDLSRFPAGQNVRVVAWLDHRYSDNAGTVSPDDPWLAIVPKAYLPVPTVTGTQQGSCASGPAFGYPYQMLEHLYYQVFLSTTAYSEAEMFEAGAADTASTGASFDPCGEMAVNPTTCDVDWDRDGVPDENEPMPETFLGQVQVLQCTLANNDPTGFVPVSINDVIDRDELDENENPSYDRKLNVGGLSATDHEGAYIDTVLSGGEQYVLVVGGDGLGPYELTVRAVQ